MFISKKLNFGLINNINDNILLYYKLYNVYKYSKINKTYQILSRNVLFRSEIFCLNHTGGLLLLLTAKITVRRFVFASGNRLLLLKRFIKQYVVPI